MKKVLAFMLALVLVLSLAACSGNNNNEKGEESKASMSKEEMLENAQPTSRKTLFEEAYNNIARARSTYVNNTYSVWGFISDIDNDSITLSGFYPGLIQAYMPSDEIIKLNAGDRIQIVGTVSEIVAKTVDILFIMNNAYFVTDVYEIKDAMGIDINYSRITNTYICHVEDDNFGNISFSTNKITNAQWNKYNGNDFKVSASGKFIKAPSGYENGFPFMDDSNFELFDN